MNITDLKKISISVRLIANSKTELISNINLVYDKLIINDINGTNMILPTLKFDSII